MRRHGLDTIFLAVPSASPHRLERIVEVTSSFLYQVSLYGVTGAREKLETSATELVRRFVAYIGGRVPLAMGFVSKRGQEGLTVSSGADSVIVGSAFVRTLQEHHENLPEALHQLEIQALNGQS
jgi:tryptophan synthase alpha chain